jgi:hypothetical protein
MIRDDDVLYRNAAQVSTGAGAGVPQSPRSHIWRQRHCRRWRWRISGAAAAAAGAPATVVMSLLQLPYELRLQAEFCHLNY